ncbi:hypothetical protein ACFRMO_19845 [Streptomyces anulatus]|uniref:hypothetical protein n=1 Tax=Streptomyces anulatus TaxID=1892 RepID=UPI0035D7C90F
MNQAKRKTIVMRRKSFSALSWAILAAMAFFATLAAEDVSSGAARGPLTGIAAWIADFCLLGTIGVAVAALLAPG